MPFLFSYVCDLLQRLDDNRQARSGLKTNATIIQDWFKGHQGLLYRDDHNSAALLSALLPEKRTDRVYFIRERKLQTIIGRALGLGRSRIAELARWTNPEARADLAECVERILKETPNPVCPAHRPVTVEEIDGVLHSIAASCRFSSPDVRSSASENRSADQELTLGELYKRLSARDAKWLTRLVLKNYEPVILDQHVVYASYHPILPAILKVQDDLVVAGRILDTQRRGRAVTGSSELAEHLKPTLGVKIGRQTWIKGRSIKHCLSMLQGRISCEEKMDGEYCQIHIDLSKGYNCIQIFSKSGKDSTRDRIALHDSIRKSLQLGTSSCPLKTGCILEGELVVYSDKDSKILDFHKIRKHVSRSGSFLGADKDSQPHPWEHLMIVYYDLLMVDNESLLAVKHSERFQRLSDLITCVPGRSALVTREVIDCDRRSAASDLRRAFAKCITARREGLVLKADDPYFDSGALRRPYSCCAIKLKKEYIGHFGDIGDFAVIGARFIAAKARAYNMPNLKWTHFYVGCLENKEEVQRFGKRPQFVVTNVVELNATQLEAFMSSVNPDSVRPEDNTAISLRIEPGVDNGRSPSVIFPTPPVFDLRCFSFDKHGNTGFWSPRFPSVSKIHCDRTYHDAISFAELQDMASKEKEAPSPEDSQELLAWIAALENSEAKTSFVSTSQSTTAAGTESMTPSPQAVREQSTVLISPQKGADPAKLPCPALDGGKLSEGMSGSPAGRQDGKTLNRKRPFASTETCVAETNKMRKFSAGPADSLESLSKSNGESPSTNRRAPVVDGRVPRSRRNNEADPTVPRLPGSVSMHFPSPGNRDRGAHGTDQLPMRAAVSFSEGTRARDTALPVPQLHDESAQGDNNSGPRLSAWDSETSGATCRFLADSCKFATYSILLSPCIASFPWVTEDLLACHGVTEFVRDPREWQAQAPNNSAARDPSGAGGRKTQRRRKIVLVDARRRDATVAFLQTIEAAQLKRRDGEREYMPVYDWKVLESIREEEQRYSRNGWAPGSRFDLNSSQGIWRRFWVGLA